MNTIAISHPGKIGDALYTLPIIRFFCAEWDATAHFYTSEYCKPMTRLMEYQSCISHVIIPPSYRILRMDVGVQPWQMPIDVSKYNRVVHLGFRGAPGEYLPVYMAKQCGALLSKLPRVYYEYPEINTLDDPYFCLAPRGETTYKELFRSVIINSPVAVAIIGGPHDNITMAERTIYNKPIVNLAGLDMLETVSWLSKCVGFVGLMSAMLVLANGFDMPKVVPHDNRHWDLRHVLKTPSHKYLILPTVPQIMEGLEL